MGSIEATTAPLGISDKGEIESFNLALNIPKDKAREIENHYLKMKMLVEVGTYSADDPQIELLFAVAEQLREQAQGVMDLMKALEESANKEG